MTETGLDKITSGSSLRETILLVEDDHALRDLLCGTLESRGYNILEVADGLEAVEVAEHYPNALMRW